MIGIRNKNSSNNKSNNNNNKWRNNDKSARKALDDELNREVHMRKLERSTSFSTVETESSAKKHGMSTTEAALHNAHKRALSTPKRKGVPFANHVYDSDKRRGNGSATACYRPRDPHPLLQTC
eukprot:CAMPEP_0118702524 /NCGR_PEP_ID=MMETSP0800-20121206/17943_1 /TAXON_ID=210618 ORGANISM="Striatella unipunctata, Strain CCMP2910" /NCGR_SAMPLE_ID=MMETSP0800 /ASSEMBLY_ACC=CAM_ASM_000638 /LENGTH=122 /DNA_ID=CAMNT_0006603743 /DNA_START=60 /DNA_END=428 /DNA_ORIENTATION=-